MFSQSPTKYEISKEGLTDFIVAEVPGKTKEEIYTKVLEWVSRTYKNPKEVLKAEILNDYVRIEGSKENLFCSSPLGMAVCNDARYQIEISVKDGKYKFDIIQLEEYVKPSQYYGGGWRVYSSINSFKKDGTVRGGWKDYINDIPNYFNSLNDDLKKYIESGVKSEQKSEW